MGQIGKEGNYKKLINCIYMWFEACLMQAFYCLKETGIEFGILRKSFRNALVLVTPEERGFPVGIGEVLGIRLGKPKEIRVQVR